jgi:hypothetical protein
MLAEAGAQHRVLGFAHLRRDRVVFAALLKMTSISDDPSGWRRGARDQLDGGAGSSPVCFPWAGLKIKLVLWVKVLACRLPKNRTGVDKWDRWLKTSKRLLDCNDL